MWFGTSLPAVITLSDDDEFDDESKGLGDDEEADDLDEDGDEGDDEEDEEDDYEEYEDYYDEENDEPRRTVEPRRGGGRRSDWE